MPIRQSRAGVRLLLFGAALLIVAIAVLTSCSGGEDGILDVEQEGTKLVVRRRIFRRSLLGESGEWKLAPGDYTILGLCVSITDEKGDKWKAVSSSLGRLARRFTIEEQKTTVLKVGAPLEIKADVMASGGGVVQLGLLVTGRGSETYQPSVTKNGVNQQPPSFTVLNEAGERIGGGKFEYG